MKRPNSRLIQKLLLGWYDRHRRSFPWRVMPGQTPDAYLVWLSEIMLQQTGTDTVVAYYHRFTERWPTVHALANASLDEVLIEWAGLGYYARARNLHACARIVSKEFAGRFPDDQTALLKLPGIGPYTAAALSAIAFNRPAPVLDGNIERVISRLYAITTPLPAARTELRPLAGAVTNCQRPGDMAQAMMDLGATLCTPRAPDCAACPLQKHCAAYAQGIAETLPRRQRKAAQKKRVGAVFWLTRNDGSVLLRRRPEKGLLGGMMEFPGTPWQADAAGVSGFAPANCNWRALPGTVQHVFTHFKLELTVYAATSRAGQPMDGIWARPDELQNFALPKLMQKVAAHAQDASRSK